MIIDRRLLIVSAANWFLSATIASAAGPFSKNIKSDNDSRLRDWICKEFPDLENERLAEWDRVTQLREFSYRHTAYSNAVDSKSYQIGTTVANEALQGKRHLVEAYEFFDSGRGGVVCGGTAGLFAELCRWGGFETWTLNSGFLTPGPSGFSFTHVVVLVRVPITTSDGKKLEIFTVHDPSVNQSYAHADGKTPLDYFEMLKLLHQRKSEEIGFSGATVSDAHRHDPITVVYRDEFKEFTPQDFLGSWNVGEPYTWWIGTEGQWIFRAPRLRKNFELLGDWMWKPELKRRGFPAETLYIHALPLEISGPGGDKLLKRAKAVLDGSD